MLLNPLLFGFWVARGIMPGYLVLSFHEQNTPLNRKKRIIKMSNYVDGLVCAVP